MSNPALPPVPPVPPVGLPISADLSGNFSSLLARMAQSGMAEIAEVLGPQPNYTTMPSGRLRATSRRHTPIAQMVVAVSVAGTPGQEILAQEGERQMLHINIYWAPDLRGPAYDPITETNYTDRWLILPQRAPGKEWRLATCLRMGPYYVALLEEGALADPSGGSK